MLVLNTNSPRQHERMNPDILSFFHCSEWCQLWSHLHPLSPLFCIACTLLATVDRYWEAVWGEASLDSGGRNLDIIKKPVKLQSA